MKIQIYKLQPYSWGLPAQIY